MSQTPTVTKAPLPPQSKRDANVTGDKMGLRLPPPPRPGPPRLKVALGSSGNTSNDKKDLNSIDSETIKKLESEYGASYVSEDRESVSLYKDGDIISIDKGVMGVSNSNTPQARLARIVGHLQPGTESASGLRSQDTRFGVEIGTRKRLEGLAKDRLLKDHGYLAVTEENDKQITVVKSFDLGGTHTIDKKDPDGPWQQALRMEDHVDQLAMDSLIKKHGAVKFQNDDKIVFVKDDRTLSRSDPKGEWRQEYRKAEAEITDKPPVQLNPVNWAMHNNIEPNPRYQTDFTTTEHDYSMKRDAKAEKEDTNYIVAIGAGKFNNAHAMHAIGRGGDQDICLYNIRGSRAIRALSGQGGMYSIKKSGKEGNVVTVSKGIIHSGVLNQQAGFDQFTSDVGKADLVTLCVTKKFYKPEARKNDGLLLRTGLNPANNGFQADEKLSVLGKLTAALYMRYQNDPDPENSPVILPMENLVNNGDKCKEALLDLANEIGDPGFVKYVEALETHNTMIDSIAVDAKGHRLVRADDGQLLYDEAAATAEEFGMIAVEQKKGDKLSKLEVPGLTPFKDIGAVKLAKQTMVNAMLETPCYYADAIGFAVSGGTYQETTIPHVLANKSHRLYVESMADQLQVNLEPFDPNTSIEDYTRSIIENRFNNSFLNMGGDRLERSKGKLFDDKKNEHPGGEAARKFIDYFGDPLQRNLANGDSIVQMAGLIAASMPYITYGVTRQVNEPQAIEALVPNSTGHQEEFRAHLDRAKARVELLGKQHALEIRDVRGVDVKKAYRDANIDPTAVNKIITGMQGLALNLETAKTKEPVSVRFVQSEDQCKAAEKNGTDIIIALADKNQDAKPFVGNGATIVAATPQEAMLALHQKGVNVQSTPSAPQQSKL